MTAKVQTIRFKDDLGNDFPDWETAPLGAVADIKLGKMLDKEKQTAGCLLPYLNNISLRWNYVDTSNLPQMYFRDHELERFGLRAGDVVVCEGGEPGRSAVWDGRLPDLKFQKAIHRVRFKESFEPCLLVLYLEKIAGTAKFEMLFTGGGIKHLTKETFSRLTVPVITLPEQRKIADFLTAVDGRIGQLIQKKALLEDYKKGVMQQLFTQAIRFKDKVNGEAREGALGCDHGNDFPDWEEKKLGEVSELVNGLTYSPEDVAETGLLVLRSSNVQGGKIVFDDNVFVTSEVKEWNLSRPNDILICVRNGSKRLIGKNAIVPDGCPPSTHGAFMTVLRGDQNKFLFQLLQTDVYKRNVYINLGATINSINGGDLKKFKFMFPSPDEQTKIADFLSAIDHKIESVATQITETQTFKRGLLQQMFV